jgi:N-acetylneuraminate synthase/sialic acid synthase
MIELPPERSPRGSADLSSRKEVAGMPNSGAVVSRSLKIGDVTIDDASPCYVIAEVGQNHQGEVDLCRTIFRAAAECGVHAVKLQKRSNRELFTGAAFNELYNSENSFGRTYGEHREFLEFDRETFVSLAKFARELGVHFLCTAFDETSLDFVIDVGVEAIKIASGDVVNIPLLAKASHTGVPLIVSTGAASWADVVAAHDVLSQGRSPFALLQCTSAYPARFEELDIKVVETYRRAFPNTVIGFSSHDNGTAMPLLAYALGARIVEKHFTIDRTLKGSDQALSLSPSGMNRLCKDLRRAHVAMGDGTKNIFESELGPIQKQRKSIVAARDLRAGTVLTASDLALKIPNKGLLPSRLPSILGRRLAVDLKLDEYLSEDHLTD